MIDQKLLNRLKTWRVQQAGREGVEPYRVFPNGTLETLAEKRPLTKEEFFAVKGFKEAKWKQYGSMLLPMMADAWELESVQSPQFSSQPQAQEVFTESDDDTYTVSSFLNLLNDSFSGMDVRIRGEVSAVDVRERTIYFSLKDQDDESLISCLIFRSHYDMYGVQLEIGQEIVIVGEPQIWKPTGRLSVKAHSVELVGEGALQKAYNDLKKKLEQEGVFDDAKKRSLPDFPERIALITSRDGAAIGDFLMNLGHFGLKVDLYHSSVEGARAVPDLSRVLRQVAKKSEQYDALVLIRGGGSLESLQAFNNETLVRLVSRFPLPVLAGIGHEKDVSLVALAADQMVSTPTATAKTLSHSWMQAELQLARHKHNLRMVFEAIIKKKSLIVQMYTERLMSWFDIFLKRFSRVEQKFFRSVNRFQFALAQCYQFLQHKRGYLLSQCALSLGSCDARLQRYEAILRNNNPERLLQLGYSLVFKRESLVRSVSEVLFGDKLTVRFRDGEVEVQAK